MEETKSPKEQEKNFGEAGKAQLPEKKKDCRDNCMHCGYHCIYLKKESEEEKK